MRFHAHPGAEPDTVVGYLGHERLGRIGAGRESLRIFRDLCSGMYMPPVGFPGWEPPQFKEAEWVGEALLMGRWMGMLELDMDRRPGRMNRPMFW